MDKIIYFDTSAGTLNLGDEIINFYFKQEMEPILNDNFIVRVPTHLPTSHIYQNNKKNPLFRYSKEAKYKFIAGTNILSTNQLGLCPNWNINIFNSIIYKNSILVGCGMGSEKDNFNIYTKILYSKVLSKKYIHSTRDERTKETLERNGYKAINTGCITLWSINKSLCDSIPKQKKNSVVFTLTDYCKDSRRDKQLIKILKDSYKYIYFWPQGSGDMEYINNIENTKDIIIIPPSLENYEKLLRKKEVDYIGTRLHAGIFAIRHGIRSIILIIDNRARDMKKTYNLPSMEREDIDNLKYTINSDITTDIRIDNKKIQKWKNQFK